MSFLKNINCSSITFCDSILGSLFQEERLKSLKVKQIKNCCGTEVFKEYDLQYPEPFCTYKTSFCRNDIFSNEEICVPEGLSCEATDYYYIHNFYFLINNELVNILPKNTNLDFRDPDDIITFNSLVNTFMEDRGYQGFEMNVIVKEECIEIEFLSLPAGVVPSYVTIHNTEICFVKLEFECQDNVNTNPCSEDTNNICNEWEFSVDLTECYVSPLPPSPPTNWIIDKIKWQLPDCSLVNEPICLTEEIGSIAPAPEAPLENECDETEVRGFSIQYCENNVSVIDFSLLVESLENSIVDFGYTGNVTVNISDSHILTIKFTNLPEGLIPLELFMLDTVYSPFIVRSNCTSYEEELPTCVWEATINTKEESNFLEGISTILLTEPNLVAPKAILQGSWTLSTLDNLKTSVEAYLSTNNINGSFSYTLDSDILTFRFEGLLSEYEPQEVIYINSTGGIQEVQFYCVDIDHIPEDQYDFDSIEWDGDCLKLKPKFFGGSDIIPDGIYNIEIEVEELDGTVHLFTACKFIDCCVKCMIPTIENLKDLDTAYKLYESILLAESCSDCACTEACEIYRELISILKLNNKKLSSNELPCGCK